MKLNGVLPISKETAEKVVEKCGTPVFVFDEQVFQDRIQKFKQAASEELAGIKWNAVYAAKAFLSKRVARIVAKADFGIDCCSETEMLTVLEGGVSGQLIGLHGNNKTKDEIEMAIRHQIGKIVVDSLDEIDFIEEVTVEMKKEGKFEVPLRTMVRITTGIHAGGHEFISTAHEDQKFGLQINDAILAIKKLQKLEKQGIVRFIGIHTHIGSQISSVDAFEESAKKMMEFRSIITKETGIEIQEVDLGGGFGVQYVQEDQEIDLNHAFKKIAQSIRNHCEKNGEKMPSLSFEPGRWLIAPAMQTLYSVGTIKQVPLGNGETRKYVSVDGGMSDNIRPALYGAKYTAVQVGKEDEKEKEAARIVGKHCESGDILVEKTVLPKAIKRGDLIAIQTTGAYGFSMASNYNMSPKPAVVAVNGEKIETVVPRQLPQSLIF